MMKILRYLIFLLVILIPYSAQATIAVVQSTSATGASTTSVTTSPAITTTSANLVICDYGAYNLGGPTLTDSKSNTYVESISPRSSAYDGQFVIGQFYAVNITGGASHTFTLTSTGGPAYMTLICKEVSDAVTSSVFDQFNTNNNPNTQTTGLTSDLTATTAQNNELISGAAIGDSGAGTLTFTATGGFTVDQNISSVSGSVIGLISARRVVSATGQFEFTYDVNTTPAVGSVATVTTWKEDVTTGAPVVVRRRVVSQP